MIPPDIIIDIIFYRFEAGQKLVRSRSNYLSSISTELLLQDGQILRMFWFDRDRTTSIRTDTLNCSVSTDYSYKMGS